MATTLLPPRRFGSSGEPPVELRFVDMLLIIIATLMFVAVVLGVTGAVSPEPVAPPQITTASAPAAIIGQEYRLTLAARGGDGRLRWRLLAGSLPDGLRIGDDGTVLGTPVRRQDLLAIVQVSDEAGRKDQRELLFSTRPAGLQAAAASPPRILAATSLIFATEGQVYRHAFTAEGGTPPYKWFYRGDIPKDLTFNPDGTLTGRPAEVGTSTVTVTVADAAGATTRQNVQITVKEGPPSRLERIWAQVSKVLRVIAWLLVLWSVFFGFGGVRVPGLIDLLRGVGRRPR